MSQTNFAALTSEQKIIWSKDLWRQARNLSFIDKVTGTDENSICQRVTELKKTEAGAKAIITLIADLKGDGTSGDRTLEGNEEAMNVFDKVINIDQLRHANRNKGRMADQRTVVKFREVSRNALAYWLSDRIDQLAFLTLAGVSYLYTCDGRLRTDVMSNNKAFAELAFAADVTAPTAQRRATWDPVAKTLNFGAATTDVVSGNYITWETIQAMKESAKTKYIRGVREQGGEETYHVFLNPRAMLRLKQDPEYVQNLRFAAARDSSNPLFSGTTVKIDGMYLHEDRRVYNTLGAASGNKWGSTGTVDGCSIAFCGAQALAMGDLGEPEWVEKEFDYDNQAGISTGKIFGFLKPQFQTMYDGDTVQDFGVLNLYTAI